MKPGDYVKIIGKDGFYKFLKEVHGTATLQTGGSRSPQEPTLAVPIDRLISLEKAEKAPRLGVHPNL